MVVCAAHGNDVPRAQFHPESTEASLDRWHQRDSVNPEVVRVAHSHTALMCRSRHASLQVLERYAFSNIDVNTVFEVVRRRFRAAQLIRRHAQ